MVRGGSSDSADATDASPTDTQVAQQQQVVEATAIVGSDATDRPQPTAICVRVPPSWYFRFPSNRFLVGYITLYADSGCGSSPGEGHLLHGRVYTTGSQSDATNLCMAGYNDGYQWTAGPSAVTNIWRCHPVNPTATSTATATPTLTPTPFVPGPVNVSA